MQINAYLHAVAEDNPSIASVIDIGTSTGGNKMYVLKLSNGPGKAGMFMDAAMNAREWMGVSVILDTIIELTDNLNINQLMLDKNDFYFLPVANPDGYKHTWDTNRAWKKTRSSNPGSSCIGTDGNRNWNYVWGDPQNGSSTDWAMGAINLSHSFTMDLPSGGSLGFNPPPADITRITTETWAAIKVFADSIPTTRG
ncbi:hypothetical protein B566_EDAN017364 [Ephemera danica]|nr:hypothetical protein B566_EDAN017364 [Ephemera danica]